MKYYIKQLNEYKATVDYSKIYEYKVENNEVFITKYIGKETNVTIPNEIEDKPVTVIGTFAFNNCDNLKSIKLPIGIEILNFGAFNGCTNLESIIIPKSLNSIKTYAFRDCLHLKNLEIHNPYMFIESDSFNNCPSLELENLDPLTQEILKKNRVELL